MNTHLHKEATAMVLIVTSTTPRQVLLLHNRKHDLWMPPGGHVESNEHPLEAAIREVKEETGLDVAQYLPQATQIDEDRVELPLPMRIVQIRVNHGGKEHFHVDSLYRVELPEAVEVKHDENESSAIGWYTLSQLDDLKIPADVLPVLRSELKP